MRGGFTAGFSRGHGFGDRGFASAGRGFQDGSRHHGFRGDRDPVFFGNGLGFYDPGWYLDSPYYDPYYGYDYPYYGYDYPYYGHYNSNVSDYSQTVIAVQRELAKLGYYHGPIDGVIGPETRKAISWFQSVDKLSVTGGIDDPTLRALQIS